MQQVTGHPDVGGVDQQMGRRRLADGGDVTAWGCRQQGQTIHNSGSIPYKRQWIRTVQALLNSLNIDSSGTLRRDARETTHYGRPI